MPSPIDRRAELERRIREEGWVQGGRITAGQGGDSRLTPAEARELGWKYLLAADAAEQRGLDGHGGPHVIEWHLDTARSAFLLTGPPIGRTELRLAVTYDDPVCADRAAVEATALLRMRDWWQPL